jgi:putative transcription factor
VQVIVDGVQLTVCRYCSKRGKAVTKLPTQNPFRKKTVQYSPKNSLGISDNIYLVDGYSYVIRNARVQKNLTHEQLGAILKEKATLLRRLETGSLKPDRAFAAKLERFLGIRLYVPEDE